MIKIKHSLVIAFSAFSLALISAPVHAQFSDLAEEGVQDVGGASVDGDIPTLLQTIVDVLLFLVGATAAIMIVISGLRFVFSRGDQQQAASARNTLLYSIVGLIVAVLAWAIVNYVLGIAYGDGGLPAQTGGGSGPTPQ